MPFPRPISALLALFLLSIASPPPLSAAPPNLVFILADDLGWADTTLYGHTALYQTPNIERLSKRGMTFTRAYTSSPLCSPTRSAILTGLHPARTGVTTPNCHKPEVVLQTTVGPSAPSNQKLLPLKTVTRLDTRYPTISKTLGSAGYTTGHFGKWHLGPVPWSPLEHGFDVDVPHHPGPGPAGSYVAPWKFKNFAERAPREHIEDRIGDEAVAFLEKHRNESFFLNYWMFSVHGPFNAKADLIEKHRARIDPTDEQRSPTYAAMMESLDDNVGKILDTLDRLDLSRNTIVIFYSDNGGNMYNEIDGTTPTANRPLRGGKGNNFDGGTRVPCIVVWPGEVEAGSRSDALITSTDFYPTLLEMLDLDPAENQSFDGISIVPALRGNALGRDAIFTYFPHQTGVPDTLPPSAAIYHGDYKLLRLFHQGKGAAHAYQLYNLADDIGERIDLAAKQPERAAALDKQIEAFLAETQAVTPQPNPKYDPGSGALAKLGWHAGTNCALALRNGQLVATHSPSTQPPDRFNFRVTLPDPVPEGKITITLRLRTPSAGPLVLRWQEQGAQPAYDKSRLASAQIAHGNDWQDLTLTFQSSAPLLSFRLDPPSPRKAELLIDHCTVTHNGAPVRSWNFSD